MGGFFGVASAKDCSTDVFFGTDYHSHLGTRRGGMAVCSEAGNINRVIHNIENSPFRTKFDHDLESMNGNVGIGCISDTEPQPLNIKSHLGKFAITTVGRINNIDQLAEDCYTKGHIHFLEMSDGKINPTELVAALINQKDSIADGIRYAQEVIDGSMSVLVLTPEGIYAGRDYKGRTPIVIGKRDDAFCASFESHAFLNLGYTPYKELGPGEIVFFTKDSIETKYEPVEDMKICTFLWVYYGYPTSTYEGVNVEVMRNKCGEKLAQRDNIKPDIIAGIPDSGTAHAIGYSNVSDVPFARPFIKYTPTWPRSFMPNTQIDRSLIAKMKLIPVDVLIKDKKLMLIDDSIVRGTQMRETTEFLYSNGAKEVHIRPACPPILFGCKYLNFSRSRSDLDLITRQVIERREGKDVSMEVLAEYADPNNPKYQEMVDEICKELNFTSLQFNRLDDMIESVGIDPCKLCTYCWNGKE